MSNRLKPRFPRCTYVNNNDGTRCARRVKPPETVCHIHQKVGAVGALTEPVTHTPLEKILKIAMRDGHPNQIQALKMLLDAEKCRECAARAEASKDTDSIVEYATAAQRTALLELIAAINAIKRDVRIHIAAGGAPPVAEATHVIDEHQIEEQPVREDATPEPRDESSGVEAEHVGQPDEEDLTPEEAAWNRQFGDDDDD